MKNEKENKWPSFEIKSWKNIPVISGKIATENDARNGLAVFCLKNAGNEHKAFEIDLPKLAYLTNEDDDSKELIVVIQAESTEKEVLIGYRNPNGGNGAGFLCEFEFLSNEEIESLERN
ncbi:hypothetical protein IVB69_05720 [Flavobacterium sp. J49]|uniref:hypothetical protein n=1 Tax=Flavobacterium sp. J49 TaxID=2718534 RepID=UPI001594ACF8|nr:hypothetical protein [Flavobacterium sp. J49]MBF6640970.1 hypothetical protein [Flavobacterium sp. J49]NIC02217.1 hypothetical protein [Flavobacterium sp. J49]